jgi:hypothetical protein
MKWLKNYECYKEGKLYLKQCSESNSVDVKIHHSRSKYISNFRKGVRKVINKAK